MCFGPSSEKRHAGWGDRLSARGFLRFNASETAFATTDENGGSGDEDRLWRITAVYRLRPSSLSSGDEDYLTARRA